MSCHLDNSATNRSAAIIGAIINATCSHVSHPMYCVVSLRLVLTVTELGKL